MKVKNIGDKLNFINTKVLIKFFHSYDDTLPSNRTIDETHGVENDEEKGYESEEYR